MKRDEKCWQHSKSGIWWGLSGAATEFYLHLAIYMTPKKRREINFLPKYSTHRLTCTTWACSSNHQHSLFHAVRQIQGIHVRKNDAGMGAMISAASTALFSACIIEKQKKKKIRTPKLLRFSLYRPLRTRSCIPKRRILTYGSVS